MVKLLVDSSFQFSPSVFSPPSIIAPIEQEERGVILVVNIQEYENVLVQ